MCVPVRAVARSFSTFRLFVCVCLCELVLGVSPRSGFFCMTVRIISGVYCSLFSLSLG